MPEPMNDEPQPQQSPDPVDLRPRSYPHLGGALDGTGSDGTRPAPIEPPK